MKHTSKITSVTQLYYVIHRMHTARFIFALGLLSVLIIVATASTLWGSFMLTVWLLIGSVFLTVVCMVEYQACDEWHAKYLEAVIESKKIKLPPNYKN
jgi:hypothetical protein